MRKTPGLGFEWKKYSIPQGCKSVTHQPGLLFLFFFLIFQTKRRMKTDNYNNITISVDDIKEREIEKVIKSRK